MLTRLSVRRFKSLREVDVDLARLVVVFGPNAAGKSNLLEAILLLSRLVRERTIADAFDGAVRGYPLEAFTFGEGGVEGLLAQPEVSLALGAEVGGGAEGLRYDVEVAIRPSTGELALTSERLSRASPRAKPTIERVEGDGGPELRVRRKDKQSPPIIERPGLNHTLASDRQFDAERFPDIDRLRTELATWSVVYLDPRAAMRQPQPPREVDDIGERGEHLVPFLHRLQVNEPRMFDAIRRATRSVVPTIEDLRTELVASRGELDLRVKQAGVWLSARVISEGTLRVLALCAMAANPYHAGLVAFEEPENGVHPRRIEIVTRILASAARRRQVVVSTHSPLVVAEVVRLAQEGELDAGSVRLVTCRAAPDGTRVTGFAPEGSLVLDDALKRALTSGEDGAALQAMQARGWLDG